MKNFKIKSGSNIPSLKTSDQCLNSEIFDGSSSQNSSHKSSLCSLSQLYSLKVDSQITDQKFDEKESNYSNFENNSHFHGKENTDLLQRIKTLTSIARLKVDSIKMESMNFDANKTENGPFLTDVQLYRKIQEERKEKENREGNGLENMCPEMNIERDLKEMLIGNV